MTVIVNSVIDDTYEIFEKGINAIENIVNKLMTAEEMFGKNVDYR